MKTLTLNEVTEAPDLIQFLWMMQNTNQIIGRRTYEEAIKSHPEYFPEEVEHRRIYGTIPQRVHNQYLMEWLQREGEIMKNQPYRAMGLLFYATHPTELEALNKYQEEKQPEIDALKKELHEKYYGPYKLIMKGKSFDIKKDE